MNIINPTNFLSMTYHGREINIKYIPLEISKMLIIRDSVMAEEERANLKLNKNILTPIKNIIIPKKENTFSTIKLY